MGPLFPSKIYSRDTAVELPDFQKQQPSGSGGGENESGKKLGKTLWSNTPIFDPPLWHLYTCEPLPYSQLPLYTSSAHYLPSTFPMPSPSSSHSAPLRTLRSFPALPLPRSGPKSVLSGHHSWRAQVQREFELLNDQFIGELMVCGNKLCGVYGDRKIVTLVGQIEVGNKI